jgi:uncharacterized protein YjbI with pentapeptide repeats
VGQAFSSTVDALASNDSARQLAGAILLRRFFDRRTEQGQKDAPYEQEAVAVIAALLRDIRPGNLQKLLADGLAYAQSLEHADLQRCNLHGAYLGDRKRRVELSKADLFEADLTYASLRGARAHGTAFNGAVMHDTVLKDADLRNADFRGADLLGARFEGAQLSGACFHDAKNVPADVIDLLDDEGNVPPVAPVAASVVSTT